MSHGCSPERCEYCIGTYCLRYQESLESEARKMEVYTTLCRLGME